MNGLLILIGLLGLAFIAIGLLDDLETRRRAAETRSEALDERLQRNLKAANDLVDDLKRRRVTDLERRIR